MDQKNRMRYFSSEKYLIEGRWFTYNHIIQNITKYDECKILEIGPGNGIVKSILNNFGYEVVTMDISKVVDCNILGDVRYLPIKNKTFDIIICSQVLEHVPFEYFEKILLSIQMVCKNIVIITLPDSNLYFSISLKIPFFDVKHFLFQLPFTRYVKDEEHFWEIGQKGTKFEYIDLILHKYFHKEKDYRIPLFPWHHLFVLKIRHED